MRGMAAGTGRVGLCVEYRERKYPIELKIKRDSGTYDRGVGQAAAYMERLGCGEGWLVIFDRAKGTPWGDRLYVKKESVGGKTVTVYGC